MTVVVFKYNVDKYRALQDKKYQDIPLDNTKWQQSLEIITNYEQEVQTRGFSHTEMNWIIHSKNVSERLSLLKDSYRVILNFRKRKSRGANADTELKMANYLSEEEGSSGTETQTGTPKRHTRRSLISS